MIDGPIIFINHFKNSNKNISYNGFIDLNIEKSFRGGQCAQQFNLQKNNESMYRDPTKMSSEQINLQKLFALRYGEY